MSHDYPAADDICLAFDAEPIRSAYLQGRLILFAGAGVSAGLGLPTFPQLVAEMARQLDIDPTQFQSYGEFRQLAEYYKIKKGNDALMDWMAREWHHPAIDVSRSPIHRLIAGSRFAHIYTTNYDRWLEAAHDAYPTPYIKIASADDLARAEDGVRQIVKLHGDLDNGAPIPTARTPSRGTCWRSGASGCCQWKTINRTPAPRSITSCAS